MIRHAVLVSTAAAALVLSGCQSEEDKKQELARINAEIQKRVEVAVQQAFDMRLSDEVQRQLKPAVATEFQRQRQIDEQLKLAAQQRAIVESASKSAVSGVKKPTTTTKKPTTTTTKKPAR